LVTGIVWLAIEFWKAPTIENEDGKGEDDKGECK